MSYPISSSVVLVLFQTFFYFYYIFQCKHLWKGYCDHDRVSRNISNAGLIYKNIMSVHLKEIHEYVIISFVYICTRVRIFVRKRVEAKLGRWIYMNFVQRTNQYFVAERGSLQLGCQCSYPIKGSFRGLRAQTTKQWYTCIPWYSTGTLKGPAWYCKVLDFFRYYAAVALSVHKSFS